MTGASGIGLGLATITNASSGQIVGFTSGVSVTGAGTVVNSGTIAASQSSGNAYSYNTINKSATVLSAAVMLGSGRVTNASGGRIAGPLGGVGIQGNGSVVNSGVLAGTDVGIVLASGGGVSNASGGSVSGLQYAIISGGTAALTVGNQGYIGSTANFAIEGVSGGVVSNASTGTISAAKIAIALYDGTNSTITNYGRIVGGTTSAAVSLSGTASVTNASGATIAGGYYALQTGRASAVSIVNAGVIDGTAIAGVYLAHGGTLTNLATGTIFSNTLFALYARYSTAATVVNQGLMYGYAYSAVMLTSGVVSNASGGRILGATNAIGGHVSHSGANPASFFTVANAGTIIGYGKDGVLLRTGGIVGNSPGGTIAGANYAVYLNGTQASTIVNAGMLQGNSKAGFILEQGGSVTNASGGTITGGIAGGAGFGTSPISVYNMAGGSIAGPDYGLLIGSANAQVTNAGTISDTQISAGAAIDVRGGGTVTNTSSGHVTSKWIGVQIGAISTAVGGTLFNQGSIYASDGTNGAAVWIHGPGYISNSSSGTINGGPYGIVAYYATSLVNAGSIGGTAWAFDPLHTGFVQHIEVLPGGQFTGTVSGGNSIGSTVVSTLELAPQLGATGTLGGIGSQFIQFGQVTVDARANWVLTGANTVVAGATLTDSGTLTNTGTVTGGVVLNGGVVSNVSGATISGTFAAVYGPSASAGGTVVNAGVLTGPSGGSGAGVVLLAGGSVTNLSSGNVIGPEGVYIASANTTANTGAVVNFGTISGTLHNGVEVGDGGSVSNMSGGTISGALNGISVSFASAGNQSATIFNQGTVAGASGYGVALHATGTNVLTNALGGTITGGFGGAYIGAGGSVTNAGTIGATGTGTSALAFGSGAANRLAIVPGAIFTGKVDGGNTIGATAVSTLELASGASPGTLNGFGSQFLDFARIVIDSGASWVLNATDTLGAGVMLINNGTLIGTVSVPSGGLFTNAAGGTIVGSGLAAVHGTSAGTATIVNAGFIDPATYGVYLPAGGSVTNVAGGTIEGTAVGIEVKGATGTVANYGTVTGAIGIQLAAGGTVLNAGTIAGTTYAVELGGTAANRVIADGGAVFTGTVSGGNTLATLELASGASAGTLTSFGSKYIEFAGVTVDAGATWTFAATSTFGASVSIASSGTLTNSAAIAAGVYLSAGILINAANTTIVGPTAAIYGPSGASAGTVVNAGALIGGSNPTQSAGVILFSGGVVSNATGGYIAAGGVGVYIAGNGSVVNAGAVAGLGTKSGGIEVTGTGSVTNAASGTITAVKHAVVLDTAGSVLNQGFVRATSTDAAAVYLNHGGAVTNAGTVIGGQQGVFFGQSGSSGGTLTTSGAITGASDAVQFSPGFTNRLIVAPGAVFSGTVDGGNVIGSSFVSTLELASAASAGTLAGIGTQFVDFGQITIDAGASWIFTGANTVAAGIGITDSGLLTNNAALPGGILMAGGTLVNAAAATISGTLAAVYTGTGGSVGTILNAGVLIGGSNATRSAGIGMRSGAYVSNAASGTISAGATGIYLAGGGTVVNAGRVIGQGTQSGGIQLSGGGAITNVAGGTISAVRRGIALIQAGQVLNQGLISVSGTTGYGINLQAGGTVVNTGVVNGTTAASTSAALAR